MQSFNGSSSSSGGPPAPPIDTLEELPKLRRLVKQEGVSPYLGYAPVTVHANYCDNKKSNLGSLGLWLAEGYDSTSSCRAFNLSNTFFGKIDWDVESFRVQQELFSVRQMPNNTVFKFVHKPHVFLYTSDNNMIRPFGSGETFLNMGYEWKNVRNIKTQYSFFMNFTVGSTL